MCSSCLPSGFKPPKGTKIQETGEACQALGYWLSHAPGSSSSPMTRYSKVRHAKCPGLGQHQVFVRYRLHGIREVGWSTQRASCEQLDFTFLPQASSFVSGVVLPPSCQPRAEVQIEFISVTADRSSDQRENRLQSKCFPVR